MKLKVKFIGYSCFFSKNINRHIIRHQQLKSSIQQYYKASRYNNTKTEKNHRKMTQLIKEINKQQKYYSFMFVQTADKQLAQKWDYFILSSDGRLLMNNQEPGDSNHQYNIGVDTIGCQMREFGIKDVEVSGSRVILAQGNWLIKCLLPTQQQLIKKVKIMRYQSLSVSKSLKFYYYINKFNINMDMIKKSLQKKPPISISNLVNQFVQIQPKFIHSSDCLIFQLTSTHPHQQSAYINFLRQKLHFKKIFNNYKYFSLPPSKDHDHDFFSFNSDYALLSDQHFLNCFVKKKKNIGSYYVFSDGYKFWIDESVFQSLRLLYNYPKL